MKGVTYLWNRSSKRLCGTTRRSSGSADPPRRSASGPLTVSQYVAWIITAVMTLFSFGVFLPFAIADNKSIGIILIGLVPMIGIPLAVAVRPYLDKKLLEQKTIYAITDQRIIAVVKSNVMTMPRDQKVTCRDGGAGNVCFNAAIGREAGKSRANAVMGIKKGNDRVVGLLFFRVSDPDAVVSALA